MRKGILWVILFTVLCLAGCDKRTIIKNQSVPVLAEAAQPEKDLEMGLSEDPTLETAVTEEMKEESPDETQDKNLENENQIESEFRAEIDKIDRKIKGYFYQEAIEDLEKLENAYGERTEIAVRKEDCMQALSEMVPYTGTVSHVFFHSLIVDTKKAFVGDSISNGYNYWMTTVDEFKKMMEEMYANNYILVDIYDLANKVTNEDGKVILKEKELLLPPGKIPFVLSVDDVNYYDYMKGDGFADRLVLDENGNVACVYLDGEEEIVKRDFDVVPLLDVFVEEHPDFSFRGAKGIIAETGYEGALGYRTNLLDSPTYEEDARMVRSIADRLKETGWKFAVHGYGHRHTKQISYDLLVHDTEKWMKEVGSLVGMTDIYIYPYGEEVDYSSDKYFYLRDQGFYFFCGVWSKPYLNIKEDYMRMTRRNLDGYTMNFRPEALSDLFDVSKVMDPARPEFK